MPILTACSMIPERALWAIFEALVSAVCIMQCGCLPDDPPPDGGRIDPVIHCNLKPLNGMSICTVSLEHA